MMNWCALPLARVYAYAAYADPHLLAFARALQGAARGRGAPGYAAPELVPALLDQMERYHGLGTGRDTGQPGRLSLVVKLDRAIDGGHLARGFENSFRSRLMATVRERVVEPVADLDGALAELRALAGAFQAHSFAEGDELVFTWVPSQGYMTLELTPARSGVAWQRLTHPTLCRAVCETYVGKGAVSQGGRDSFAANLHAFVSGSGSGSGSDSLAALVAQEYLARKA